MIIEPNENRPKYFAIAGIILFFILGFLAAYFWMNAKIQKTSKDCAASLAEIKKTESTIPAVPKIQAPSEFFSISGKVENIDGQKITIKGFSFGEQKTYIVTVGDDTKITKREMDLSPPKEGVSAPPKSKETDISLADIRVGDSLTIDSADNIKDKTEFIAKSIFLEIITGLPAPPALPDMNSIPTPPEMPKIDNLPVPPTPPAVPGGNMTAPAPPVAPPAPPIAPK